MMVRSPTYGYWKLNRLIWRSSQCYLLLSHHSSSQMSFLISLHLEAYIEVKSIAEPELVMFSILATEISYLCFLFTGNTGRPSCSPGFPDVGSEDLNSSPHFWTASISSNQPSSLALLNFFMFSFCLYEHVQRFCGQFGLFFVCLLTVLPFGIESIVLCLQNKYSTTELHPQIKIFNTATHM